MLLCNPVRPGLYKAHHLQHHDPCFWHVLSSYILVTVQSFHKCELTEFSQEPFEMSPFYKRGNWGTEPLDHLPKVTYHQGYVPWVTWHPLGRQSRSPQRWSAGASSGGALVPAEHRSVVTGSTASFLHPVTTHIFVESPGLCGIWAQLHLFQWWSKLSHWSLSLCLNHYCLITQLFPS